MLSIKVSTNIIQKCYDYLIVIFIPFCFQCNVLVEKLKFVFIFCKYNIN